MISDPASRISCVQQADGIHLGIVGAEGIGADELGAAARVVRIGQALRPHFMQHHPAAGSGRLPGSLRTGETRPDDVNDVHVAHGPG